MKGGKKMYMHIYVLTDMLQDVMKEYVVTTFFQTFQMLDQITSKCSS